MRKAATLLAIALAAVPAAAEDEPRWFADIKDEAVLAKWGIPEADAVGFVVACLDNGELEIKPALFAIEQPDEVPHIRFLVDGEPYVRNAKLGFIERDVAWQASAVVRRDDALVDALRRGSKLTYDFDPPLREGDAFTLSLSGSAKAIDEALKNC